MYQIEKDVQKPGMRSRYPFQQMAIGDSFLVPAEPADVKTVTAIRGAVSAFQKRVGGRFSVLRVDGGWRVWRNA
jgi:hypothetical protein